MAGISLGSIQGLKDPAPAWRFIVSLPSLPAIAATAYTEAVPDRSAISAARVETVSLPHFIIVDETEYYGGGADFFPTTTTIGDLSLGFYETGNYDATAYLYHWLNLVVDTQGNYGLPINYKKTITFKPLDVTGKPAGEFKLMGCWPTTVNAFEYTTASGERIVATATFKVQAPKYVFTQANQSSPVPTA